MAPANIRFSMMGFADQVQAQALADAVHTVIAVLGRCMDLGGLDGVTIGHDYVAALASVDRGMPGLRPLRPTDSDASTGVAMAPQVLRDGAARTHLVFWAHVLQGLLDGKGEGFRQSIALIAHECGHAVDHLERERAMPGVALRRAFSDDEEALLLLPAMVVWEEYVASRLAAPFGTDETETGYREGLTGALGRARRAANEAIKAYRLHSDVGRVLSEAGNPIAEPLRFGSYLAGHVDGRGRDAIEEMREMLAADDCLGPQIVRTVEAVRVMWDRRGRWDGLSAFEPLKDVIRSAFAVHGITIRTQQGHPMRVEIPFTPETMPAVPNGCFGQSACHGD